jgi:Tol biopolymer transport system component
MKSENRFALDLDSAAGLVTAVLLLAIALVIFIGVQLGVRVTAQFPTKQAFGPYEALTLVFSEPVNEALVMEKFFIQPEIKGKFEWADAKTMRFMPLQPFEPDTQYSVALTPGLLTNTGKQLKQPQNWKFQTRSPWVVYLVAEEQKSRLWTVSVDEGISTPLTDDSFQIFDFDTSYNGEFVVFSAFNEEKGIDLWRVQRTGGSPTLLLQCGPDRCSVPAISPGDRMIAYVREAAAPTGELAYGSPRIWVLNLETRQNAPLYEDQQIIGYGPTWSPDGSRLSSYDGIQDEIRLLDLISSQQLTIPSQLGNPVSWSGDGESLIYTDIQTNEFGVHTRVYQAKISINEIIPLFGDNDQWDYSYNVLAWSPAENKLLLGLRPAPDDPSMALWLIDPYNRDGQVIVDQSGYSYNNPSWDPWGRTVIFQQFKLKGVYKPEIALWMPGFDQPQVLAEGLMPHWLP